MLTTKTPDQIRRETTPVKHTGLAYGFLVSVLGVVVWFGGWALIHPKQVQRYPAYVVCSIKATASQFSFMPKPKHTGMNAEQLRYNLMRYGNQDHRFDAEIVKHGWYPREASPRAWVFYNGNVPAMFSDSPLLVWKWPVVLSLLTALIALIWGMVADARYHARVVAGIPFDGSVLATVTEYKAQTKGDGIKYKVKAWSDR